ncbi:MAG: DMT family transporter [Methanomassiliicoccaceae archaeon]|nr:DMT family transporter [Methanomassiliicoccaceae archaeon]
MEVNVNDNEMSNVSMVEKINAKRKQDNKRRVLFGYAMALFCAVFWGLWYIPGDMIWYLDPFVTMQAEVTAVTGSETTSFMVFAILITGVNALLVVLALCLWNLWMGKFTEMKRTFKEVKAADKWYFLAAICGATAVLGSFMAMGFIGAAFAAVTALLYPVVGSIVSRTWLGQKISRRAMIGIFVIVLGGITAYAGGFIEEISSGDIRIWGFVGGIMAAVGWGFEGCFAGKALDVSEPDVGIHMRFIFETLIWWVVVIPILALAGFPMFDYLGMIFESTVFIVLLMLGLTFGFCYVTWYKSFPLIGVGRGQAVGSLYAIMAVVFIFMFTGANPGWLLVIGAVICVVGGGLMASEGSEEIASLRDTGAVE